MEKLPTISVIVPFFNCENYLSEALDSILKQNYKPLDIIAIDDGSTDRSLQIAESYLPQIRILTQTNQGAAKARNHGIEKARGQFLAFLDADDVWMSNKLSSQITVFNEHPELDMVFGGVEQFHSPELNMEDSSSTIAIEKHPLGILAGTMLIKRSSFLKVGLFDPNWKVGEFIDWYTKAKENQLSSIVIPQTVLRRRIHRSNLGIRARDARSDYVHILKAALDRKRKS